MKDYIEKVIIYAVPFLIIVSICYNNGYWSLYPINIYDYYQASDILKAAASPAFSFIGLVFIPLIIAASIAFASARKDNSTDEAKKAKAKIEHNATELKINNFVAKYPFIDSKYFYIPLITSLLGIAAFAAIQGIVALWQSSLEMSSYSDDAKFMRLYFTITDKGFLRSLQACILVPVIAAASALLINMSDDVVFFKPFKIAAKTFVFTLSIMLTFTLSYNAGRVDAYKIIAGYDFYFMIDNKNEPHKYLGKLDKYFFFLDDNKIIDPKDSTAFLLNSLPYSTGISIISEDSIKFLRLQRHSPNIIDAGPDYYKKFQIRKFDKELKAPTL